jgi:hypothetical protein
MAAFRIVGAPMPFEPQQQGWAVQRSDDDGQSWITITQALPTKAGAKLAMERLEAVAQLENLPPKPLSRR